MNQQDKQMSVESLEAIGKEIVRRFLHYRHDQVDFEIGKHVESLITEQLLLAELKARIDEVDDAIRASGLEMLADGTLTAIGRAMGETKVSPRVLQARKDGLEKQLAELQQPTKEANETPSN